MEKKIVGSLEHQRHKKYAGAHTTLRESYETGHCA
jgi:hypothetical protein